MNVWMTGAMGVAVALIAATYIAHVRIGGSGMHRAAPAVIALAVLTVAVNELALYSAVINFRPGDGETVAVNELVVIPAWGVEAGTRAASAFFWCVMLPASVYLSSRRTR